MYHNLAVSGSTTIAGLGHTASALRHAGTRADLILIDHSVNDAKASWSARVGVERTIRELRCLKPEAAILMSSMLPSFKYLQNVHDAYMDMCRYYNITLVDLYQVGKYAKVWYGGKHPGWQTHHYVADLIAGLMNQELDALTKDPQLLLAALQGPPCQELLPSDGQYKCKDSVPWSNPVHNVFVCRNLCSAFFADADSFALYQLPVREPVLPTDGSWRLLEDRKGKPGWISSNLSTSWLEFEVSFSGEDPKLQIDYLVSYNSLGRAEVKLEGMESGYTLNGIWRIRASQTVNFKTHVRAPINSKLLKSGTVPNMSPFDNTFGFGVQKNMTKGKVLIRLASGSKFKILSVITC